MKNRVLFLFVLISSLSIAGCGGGPAKPIPIAKPESIPPSGLMTLSQEQLLALDWHSPNRRAARVSQKRVVGSGVEFDISFPSNIPGNTTLDYLSSGEGGRGSVVGGDISGFKAFALKFTLVSVNGSNEPDVKQKLVAGALIGPTPSDLSTYVPVTLGMADSEKTATSQTPTRTDNIRTIGFHLHTLKPQNWPESESKVTIRIEPAEDAAPAPWLPELPTEE